MITRNNSCQGEFPGADIGQDKFSLTSDGRLDCSARTSSRTAVFSDLVTSLQGTGPQQLRRLLWAQFIICHMDVYK